jgi:hypothetical protein
MKRNVSVVRLIVATRSSGPPASGKIIKEMPGSVASGTLCIKTMIIFLIATCFKTKESSPGEIISKYKMCVC